MQPLENSGFGGDFVVCSLCSPSVFTQNNLKTSLRNALALVIKAEHNL